MEQIRELEDSQKTEKEIYDFKSSMEKDLTIVGASVVEDILQEDLQDTIISIKKARIPIWVITGDKRDTAINIAF